MRAAASGERQDALNEKNSKRDGSKLSTARKRTSVLLLTAEYSTKILLTEESPVDMEHADVVLIFKEEEKVQLFLSELIKFIPSFGMHPALTKCKPRFRNSVARTNLTKLVHCTISSLFKTPLKRTPTAAVFTFDYVGQHPQYIPTLNLTVLDIRRFAFADDWVVCAESQARLKEKLEAAAVELGRAGMKINARKTKAMVICGDRKHRATAVSVEPFCFAEELITPLGPTDTVTYLGIPFTFKGKGVFNHRQHLLKLLDELRVFEYTMLFRLNWSHVITVTQCRVLRNVVNDSAFGKVVRDLSLPIRVHGSCVNTKEELVVAWGDSLHNSVDGRGLRELVASPLSNRWLAFPERVFPRIFIRGIQLRCNLLRTRVRSARHGHGGQTILCRGNCGQPESLVHILQSCWITHDARCARHNRVARELAKRLRRLGYTVFEELRAPTSTSFIQPDLIAVRERRATVIDVSIVSDGRGVTVWNEKKQRYGADEFPLAIISALRAIGCDVEFLVHQPMIISYRGICFPQSAKAVIGLGLSKVTVSDLCLLAIVGSLRTYDTFMRVFYHHIRCISCPPGLFYASTLNGSTRQEVVNCTQCPENTILQTDAHATRTVSEACIPCEPGTKAVNRSVCVVDTMPVVDNGMLYNLTELLLKNRTVYGANLFTPTGTKYHYEYHLSFMYGHPVRCVEEYDAVRKIFSNRARETTFHLLSYLLETRLLCKCTRLGDRLERAVQSNHSKKFWDEVNTNLTRAGWTADSVGTDLHYIFVASGSSENCPSGVRTVVTFRCGLGQSLESLNSSMFTDQGQLELPPSCPDATCDGCTYHFLWRSSHACPICSERQITRFSGECRYGSRRVYAISREPCRIPTELLAVQEIPCPLLTTAQIVAIFLTGFTLITLVTIIFSCYRKNKRLEYKYMKLVQSKGGMGQPTSCALDENEEDNLDHFGRRAVRSNNVTNAAFELEATGSVKAPTSAPLALKMPWPILGPILFK
ncbi:UPF0577 protein KIAA1324-like homolog, partial [Clonorchis sinensis]